MNRHPSRCAESVEDRELSRLALVLVAESHRQREALEWQQAALVIQATWRAVLARRKFKAMQAGFKKLQKLYREVFRHLPAPWPKDPKQSSFPKLITESTPEHHHHHRRRLFEREVALNDRFKESEVAFDKEFQAMIARRMSSEERLRKMEAKPPKELADYLMALEREEELDAERNQVGRELNVVGRIFGVALLGVVHSALRGHFGV